MLEELARRHGLRVRVLDVDETGWDFRVGHAVDAAGVRWVLRVPRRTEVAEQLEVERRLLAYLRTRLRVRLPEWEICSPELVAYRRLPGRPLAPEHPETLEYQWWTEAPAEFFKVLGEVIAELHRIPAEDVAALGIAASDGLRQELGVELRRAETELEVPAARSRLWRAWLDDDRHWPGEHCFVHADLHPGHTLVDESGRLLGVLDWTDAAIDDPAVDFVAVHNAFGEAGLERLLAAYRAAGGLPRPRLREHIELLSGFRFGVSLGLHGLDTGNPGFVAIAQRRIRS
ncbi:Mph(A) family macrolide 2'-phosphotransferase [Saccharopolyspora halophila]|uniref:Mph(A) family macrolide 2'-phosphotransferase n=1 Tax=Saccharopolyspora halophila TaxID=405551 RepID=A0ABN3G879_9PSEU